MPLNIDFGKAGSGGSFPPVEEQLYRLYVDEATLVATKNGDPMFKIVIQYDKEAHHDMAGRKIWDQFPVLYPNEDASQGRVTKGTIWKLKEVFEAITEQNYGDDEVSFDEGDLVGMKFVGYVKNEEYPTKKMDPVTGASIMAVKQVIETYLPESTSIDGIERSRSL